MQAERHIAIAQRVEASLEKCGPADYEMKIEAAMLAGTHWLNALLHRQATTRPEQDVFHTYLLVINEFRRLAVAARYQLDALARIEDVRAPFVRGNQPGGEAAAERALKLLAVIRTAALATD